MANQSFSSSAAHCAQHSSHTVPRLLVVVVAAPFCLVPVVFAIANQSSLSATTSSVQKVEKTVEISIKILIISIVDKLLGINLAARRQQRLLPAPSPIEGSRAIRQTHRPSAE